jgi:hypothetical protein
MKTHTILLAVIAVILALNLWKLGQVQGLLERSGQDAGSIVASNQAVIGSMQKLSASFDSLRQELADFREKVLKK